MVHWWVLVPSDPFYYPAPSYCTLKLVMLMGGSIRALLRPWAGPYFRRPCFKGITKAKGLGQSLVSGMPCFKGITHWKALAKTIGF